MEKFKIEQKKLLEKSAKKIQILWESEKQKIEFELRNNWLQNLVGA
ncbi:hypothetical protein ACYSNW_07315 [Enterococcus sp. LJL99]